MKKRRFRSPHPGIKFKKRKCVGGQITYMAMWLDPDSHRQRTVSMDSLGLTNEEQRRAWAAAKSREIRRRKEDIVGGSPVRTQTVFSAAVERYLADRALEIRPRTVEIYRECIARFLRWAEIAHVVHAEQLSPAHLAALRSYLMASPKRLSSKGGKRGQRVDGADRRSPSSINRDLRSIKTLLNEWRRRGLTPLLNSDHVADHLKYVRAPQHLKEFLDQTALSTLFNSCLSHDGETFKLTRREHLGLVTKGSTPRHFDISPFVLTVLLTGCRLGEVTKLKWRQVLLDQGYIALDDATGIKTARGRRISLDETPLLAKLLSVLKLRSGGWEYVFGGETPVSHDVVENCRARLMRSHGAPRFTWQMLRRTCGTFLTCADGLYRGSSAWISAARLGHSVEVAQRHYIGALRNIPRDAKTLEGAMGLEDQIKGYFRDRLGIPLDDGDARTDLAASG